MCINFDFNLLRLCSNAVLLSSMLLFVFTLSKLLYTEFNCFMVECFANVGLYLFEKYFCFNCLIITLKVTANCSMRSKCVTHRICYVYINAKPARNNNTKTASIRTNAHVHFIIKVVMRMLCPCGVPLHKLTPNVTEPQQQQQQQQPRCRRSHGGRSERAPNALACSCPHVAWIIFVGLLHICICHAVLFLEAYICRRTNTFANDNKNVACVCVCIRSAHRRHMCSFVVVCRVTGKCNYPQELGRTSHSSKQATAAVCVFGIKLSY